MRIPVEFELNGVEVAELIEPTTTLFAVLRGRAGDNSVKGGCLQGTCGACNVLVDGELRASCLTLAADCNGQAVATVKSLEEEAGLHPIQQAIISCFATQCGFCAPGMIMAAKALLDINPTPDREAVIDAISGNVCRCTGYEPIIQAILVAAETMKSGRPAAMGTGAA